MARGGLDEEKYAKFLEHSKSTHALGRVGQPEEVQYIRVAKYNKLFNVEDIIKC